MRIFIFLLCSVLALAINISYLKSKYPPFKENSCIIVDMRSIGSEKNSPNPAYFYIQSNDLSSKKTKVILISSTNEYSARYESYNISFARLKKIPALEVSCD